jgi:hypothetical protein
VINGFPVNPTDLSDVQRGFRVIGAGGIIDTTTIVQDTDGRYKLNLDGTTLAYSGGFVGVNVDGTTLGIPAGGTKLAVLSPLAGWKNFIINPLLDIWQRGTTKTTVAGAAQFYLADRFLYQQTTSTATATVAQAVDAPDTTATNSLKVTIGTAEAALAAGSNLFVSQIIEGTNLRAFNGRTVTLSFWVKSSITGTFCVSFGNSGRTR